MSTVARWSWMPVLLALASPAFSQHHHSASFASFSGQNHQDFGGNGQSVVVSGYPQGGGGGYSHGGGGGYGHWGGGFGFNSFGYGFGVSNFYPTPLILTGPVFPQIYPIVVPQGFANGQGGGGLMLPMPPRQLLDPNPRPARRPNPSRAKEQVEIGDRSFRAGNIKRAEEKYNLAAKADPTAPMPHVHLAQVSLARGDYAAAADHLRDAVTVAADRGWLLNAPDIQSVFGEPADFARQLARLESHLQANPNDRDAWFVLGVENYLSGRSKQASDVFQRLTDRRPDEALAAFIDASKPN